MTDKYPEDKNIKAKPKKIVDGNRMSLHELLSN